MKFRVGDKVRILPSAVDISVVENEVGKVGEILEIHSLTYILINTATADYAPWIVRNCDIELVVVKGQQLTFSFMSDVNST